MMHARWVGCMRDSKKGSLATKPPLLLAAGRSPLVCLSLRRTLPGSTTGEAGTARHAALSNLRHTPRTSLSHNPQLCKAPPQLPPHTPHPPFFPPPAARSSWRRGAPPRPTSRCATTSARWPRTRRTSRPCERTLLAVCACAACVGPPARLPCLSAGRGPNTCASRCLQLSPLLPACGGKSTRDTQ